MTYLESDNMTNNIFGMIAYVEIKISHCIWWNWQNLWWKLNTLYWGQTFYLWWFWIDKIVGRQHKSCDCAHQFTRHSNRSALFTTSMALRWILFCAMKTIGIYIILVGIFYQLLIQTFSFSCNIYLTIGNIFITTHLIMMFLPYIFHIINCNFDLINPSKLINSKRQPRHNLLNKYRKKLYGRKIKIMGFFTTNIQLVEKTDEATYLIKKKLSDNWADLFKKIWTATKRIPVQHRETMENTDRLFRGKLQGQQQLAYWLFRWILQGKLQLTYWPLRGRT